MSDVIRWAIGGAGLAAGGYGGWVLLDRQEAEQIVDAGLWLVSGVLLHDVAVTAAVLLAALGVGLLPRTTRAPAAVALVVVGSLSLAAIPVLGRFGERVDNPTHLDRPYLAGWLVLVALSVIAVAIAGVVRARRQED